MSVRLPILHFNKCPHKNVRARVEKTDTFKGRGEFAHHDIITLDYK